MPHEPARECLHCHAARMLARIDHALAHNADEHGSPRAESKDYAIEQARAALQWMSNPDEYQNAPCADHARR